MHTASSANFTYFASRSASEYTMTALMPISRQARWILSAISPRLATSIFLNMSVCALALFDHEQRLSILHGLTVFAEYFLDDAALV